MPREWLQKPLSLPHNILGINTHQEHNTLSPSLFEWLLNADLQQDHYHQHTLLFHSLHLLLGMTNLHFSPWDDQFALQKFCKFCTLSHVFSIRGAKVAKAAVSMRSNTLR